MDEFEFAGWLEPGRYYARWIESSADLYRLACNCGYRSAELMPDAGMRESADCLHGAH
jgi:hypothetical protein